MPRDHDERFQASGDGPDDEKQKDILIRLGSNASLWHDPDNEAYATLKVKTHKENHRLRSKPFKTWLIQQFYKEAKTAPGSQALQDALGTLEAKAVFDGPERSPGVRLAPHGGAIYLDVGDTDWRAIEITGAGWKVIADPPVPFIRPRGMRPLPMPVNTNGHCEEKALEHAHKRSRDTS